MLCSCCSHEVRPVVALDIDNTLADWTSCYLEFLSWWLPVDAEPGQDPDDARGDRAEAWYDYDGSVELSEYLRLDKRVYQESKVAFRAGGFKRKMEAFEFNHPGTLAREAKRLGCEIWITTTRPWMRFDNLDPDTREWLYRNDVYFDHLLYAEDKYQQLQERVEPSRIVMILEDQWDQYDLAAEDGLPVVLRKTNWNRAIHRPVEVATLKAARELLAQRVITWKEAVAK